MHISPKQIAEIIGIASGGLSEEKRHFIPAFDSRIMPYGSHNLFFAFGEKGAQSCLDAYQKGCRFFISENKIKDSLPDAILYYVPNTLQALQELAQYQRAQFSRDVIGVTGSNGKTIVKEWIAQFSRSDLHIAKNPGSYNSQMGVPLSLLLLSEDADAAIFEAGISQKGEMDKLEQLIRPRIGIFTFWGDAHIAQFHSKEELLQEKMLLFRHCDQIILEKNAASTSIIKKTYPEKEYIEVSIKDTDADTCILFKNGKIQWFQRGKELGSYTFHRRDHASLLNLALAIQGALLLGISQEQIGLQIPFLVVPEGRLRLLNGIHSCKILNDSYSADMQSLKTALEELQHMPEMFTRTLILSDFPETYPGHDLYVEMADLCNTYPIHKVILIGSKISAYSHLFHGFSTSFKGTREAMEELNPDSFFREAILIKGARSFRLEQLVALLEEQNHECTLEINLDAISHNFKQHKLLLPEKTKLMLMVKAFSYGTGSVEMARHLEYLGADYLSVAYADEGVQLRKAGIRLPIMVMSPEIPGLNAILHYKLEPEVYNFRSLQFILKAAEMASGGDQVRIHIKLDTGMHRLGFMPEETDRLIDLLIENPLLHVASIFTHLVGADDPELDTFSREQIRRFRSESSKITQAIGYRPLLHFQNSAGIARFSESESDMARLGIGIYGYTGATDFIEKLQPALSFKTVITAIREIEEPETVGYNRRGKIKGKARIATISAGYADGIDRKLGLGRYKVKIGDQFAPTIGSICMDMTMVDVTHIPCNEGDEVILFGPDHPLEGMAEKCDTIPYEILTGIGQRVKRIYIKE